MIYEGIGDASRARRTLTGTARMLLALKLDGPLLIGLALVAAYGLMVLYSASGQSMATVIRQTLHLGMGALAMLLLAMTRNYPEHATELIRHVRPSWLRTREDARAFMFRLTATE